MVKEIEPLYQQAKSALKAKDYDSAIDLLRQILLADENYKDASRLLAHAVKLRRRRWYTHPLFWGGCAAAALIGLGLWLAPRIGSFTAGLVPVPTAAATESAIPASTRVPTSSPAPTATPIPLTWKRIYLGQEFSRDTITAIAIDPKDPEVIYAGMENAGIYKSIDGALSWRPSFAGLEAAYIQSLAINPVDPLVAWAGVSTNGLYKTEDGGLTWTMSRRNESGWPWCSDVILDPRDPSVLYYSEGINVWSSKNGSDRWFQIENFGNSDVCNLAISLTDSSLLYGNNRQLGFFASTDFGDTWDAAGIGGGEGESIQGLWLDPTEDGTIFISISTSHGNELYKSVDGGLTWIIKETPGCSGMAFDPVETGVGYCASGSSVFKTTDGGERWTEIENIPQKTFSAIALSADEPNSIFVGTKGLIHSMDGGTTWEPSENGLGIARIELFQTQFDPASLYLVEADMIGLGWRIFRSTDGGANWDLVNEREGNSISFDASGEIMYWSDSKMLQGSWDGGKTWQNLYFGPIYRGFVTHPTQPGILYGFGRDDTSILTSWDGGGTWQLVDTNDDCGGFQSVSFGSSGSGVVYANSDCPYATARSDDEGHTWEVCANLDAQKRISRSSLVVDPRDNDHIYLATKGRGIKTSGDGCQTWRDSNSGLESLFINSIAIDPNDPDTVYAGTDDGAYISIDGGENWGQINDGLLGANVVYSILVDAGSNVYAATPYGVFRLEGR
jgi:photosystem II stability/assembly factor-like uncharacterized protein